MEKRDDFMKKRLEKTVSLMLAVMMALLLPSAVFAAEDTDKADWALYIYMCGSNLESDEGCATMDLFEMIDADLPDNVKIVVFTGGADVWDPYGYGEAYYSGKYIKPDAEVNQLFLLDDGGMTLLKTYDRYMDMGEAATAVTFLEDAMYYAPAEHIMLEFWDHGNGIKGAVYDDLVEYGSHLTVKELQQVAAVAARLNGGKKIDIVSFDACLMSTVEVAYALSPYADYLLASEETEPGFGWDYRFLSELGAGLSAVDLGKAVVDNYAYSLNYDGDWGQNFEFTLSLTDLSKMERLYVAFDAFFGAALEEMEKDPALYAELARIAEYVQSTDESCMIDLYDFMYRVSGIDVLKEEAEAVISALGSPPGSDLAGYEGYVSSEYFAGAALGDGAVLYRGTGQKKNRCIGMSFYYPTVTSTMSLEVLLGIYEELELTDDNYTEYILYTLTQEFPGLVGDMQTSYNAEDYTFHLSFDYTDDLYLLKRVDMVTLLTDMNKGTGEMETLLLGSEIVTNGWETNDFFAELPEYWYSLGGHLITVMSNGYDDFRDYGLGELYSFLIPSVVADNNGTLMLAYISASYAVYEGDSGVLPYPSGVIAVDAITAITEDGEGAAPRSLLPTDIAFIYPTLALYDMDALQVISYNYYDGIVEFEPTEYNGNRFYTLPITVENIVSSSTSTYASYFEATDLNNETHLSEPFYYVIFNSAEDFEIGTVMPQAYTGEAVEPEIRLLYQGMELLDEGVDYTVSYSGNIEKGTATVTVTLLLEGVEGELTTEFLICDYEELAEESVKLLQSIGHDVLTGCIDNMDEEGQFEYVDHIHALEAAVRCYEYGCELSAEGLEYLNEQYGILLENIDAELTDGGVELIGKFTAYGLIIGDTIASSKLSAESKAPAGGNALTAYNKAVNGAEVIDCFCVELYGEDGTALSMTDGEQVTLKLALPDGVNAADLKLFLITDASDEPTELPCTYVERGGERYLIFDTDSLGYFALLYGDRNPATGVSAAVSLTAVMSLAAAAMLLLTKK